MHNFHLDFKTIIHCHSPDGQQWRLWDLKHKSLHWMVLFIHDHHHNLLSLILHKERTVQFETILIILVSLFLIKYEIKTSPSLSVAWHNGACLECTDLTQDDMTSVKLNISDQIPSATFSVCFPFPIAWWISKAVLIRTVINLKNITCTGTLYFFLFWKIPDG